MARRYKHRRKLQLTMLECILLVIAGLLMGTVFTFGMGYWNESIAPEEALSVTAEYTGHEVDYGRRRSINEIDLLFADHGQLTIAGCCISSKLLDALASLKKGDTLDMLVHPNGGNTVLSITAQGETLLAFEDAMQRLSVERWGFLSLGLFAYLWAGIGAYCLIKRRYY